MVHVICPSTNAQVDRADGQHDSEQRQNPLPPQTHVDPQHQFDAELTSQRSQSVFDKDEFDRPQAAYVGNGQYVMQFAVDDPDDEELQDPDELQKPKTRQSEKLPANNQDNLLAGDQQGKKQRSNSVKNVNGGH